jgi:N-acetylmuramoyl-L-alanine amidase
MKKVLYIVVMLVFTGVAAGQAKTMSIARDEVNVRAKPSKKAEVLYQASRGYPVLVKKRQKDWLYVEDWNGKKGWVYAKLVSPISTTVIKVEEANVRKGPSQKNASIAKAKQGEIYKVLAERHDWVRIGYYLENEPVGWIHEDLVWGY